MSDNVLIYDLETVCPVPPEDGNYVKGIKYCKGWHDHAGMGVAVLVAWFAGTNRTHVILADNAQLFVDLVERSRAVCSFNGDGFDAKVIKACWGYELPQERSFDAYAEIRRARVNKKSAGGKTYSLGLESISLANGWGGKEEGADLAPILWQQGRWGRVIDYCIGDVDRTTKVAMGLGYGTEGIKSPVPNERIHTRTIDETLARKEYHGFNPGQPDLFDASVESKTVWDQEEVR